jgi:hypothetical protein
MEGFSFLAIALTDWQGRRSHFPIGLKQRRDARAILAQIDAEKEEHHENG